MTPDGQAPTLGDNDTQREIDAILRRFRQIEEQIDALREAEYDGSAAYYLAMDEINELEDEFVALDQELYRLRMIVDQGLD